MTQAFEFTAPDSYILNCSTLLTELPVLERAQAAKDAGFDRARILVALRRQPAPHLGGGR